MATRGRRPLPSAVKKIKGNPGKRPLNDGEPKPGIASLECPPELEGAAKECWEKTAPQLAKLELLTCLDEQSLILYCLAWERYLDANESLKNEGTVISSPNGCPIQNPHMAIANTAFEQMRKLATEFGMTPSSRTRLNVSTEQEKDDPFAELASKTVRSKSVNQLRSGSSVRARHSRRKDPSLPVGDSSLPASPQ